MLKENIYYVDEKILKRIKSDFELIENKGWFLLYENKIDNSLWRLDQWDKNQVQIFVKIESEKNWVEFDDKELRIELLKKFRGLADEKCKWINCDKTALNNLVFCEIHAYTEMGIRK